MASQALAHFEEVLRSRVRDVVNDDYVVECRFGSSLEWDDPTEGTRFLWRRLGFDPDLALPRLQISDPAPASNHWRSCVAFDEQTVDYWPRDNTAIFFADATWGSLEPGSALLVPSLGNSLAGPGGVLGVFTMVLREHGRSVSKALPDGRTVDEASWTITSFSSGDSVWKRMARQAGRSGDAPTDVPLDYVDDFVVKQVAYESREECLGALLPNDLRSPFLVGAGAAISYSLGWLALVYGLKFVVDHWQEVNGVLAEADLPGFGPMSSGQSHGTVRDDASEQADIHEEALSVGNPHDQELGAQYLRFGPEPGESMGESDFAQVGFASLNLTQGIFRVRAESWGTFDEDGDVVHEEYLGLGNYSLIHVPEGAVGIFFSSVEGPSVAWLSCIPATETPAVDPVALGLTGGRYLVGHDLQPGEYVLTKVPGVSQLRFRKLDHQLRDVTPTSYGPKDSARREVTIEAADFAIEIAGLLEVHHLPRMGLRD